MHFSNSAEVLYTQPPFKGYPTSMWENCLDLGCERDLSPLDYATASLCDTRGHQLCSVGLTLVKMPGFNHWRLELGLRGTKHVPALLLVFSISFFYSNGNNFLEVMGDLYMLHWVPADPRSCGHQSVSTQMVKALLPYCLCIFLPGMSPALGVQW